MSVKGRIVVAALTLSAAAFVARIGQEGYTETAVIPTEGDVPTVGFGSTAREDGARVRLGERTDPVSAVRRALSHIQKDEAQIKACIGLDVPLYQTEFDVFTELAYNIGAHTFCTNKKTGGPGAIPRALQAREYARACNNILLYKFAAGYDCSTIINGQPNKRCYGVWLDRLRLHQQCMSVQ